MKTSRLPILLVASLLICMLGACSMQKLAERITPDGDLALVHALFQDLRSHHLDAARARFDANDVPSDKALEALSDMLEKSPQPKLIGANVSKKNDDPWQTTLTYQFGSGDQTHAVALHITGAAGHRHFDAMGIARSTDMSGVLRIAKWLFSGLLVVVAGAIVLVIWLVRRNRRKHA